MSASDRSDQVAVGHAWEEALKGKGYPLPVDARFLRRFRTSPYIRLITRYARLCEHSRILEPGCGSGKFSLALGSLGHRPVALDYVADVLRGLRVAEKELSARRWPGQLSGYCQGDLENLPFADSTFDLVMNEGVVEHWLDEEKRLQVLREMVRVAKPGGTVAVLVPNGVHPLICRWQSRLHHSAPPMTLYSANRLGGELQRAGLGQIYTDGIYPWRSWMRLAPWHRLYMAGALLDHIVPLPRDVRQRWGINLISLGKKPEGC